MMNDPGNSPFAYLKPLLLLGLTLILLVFARVVWKHLPGEVSVPDMPVSSTVERVYLGPRNSLAILAFDTGIDGATPGYLAGGVARELANLLAAVPSLQLTAPTSSLYPGLGDADLSVTAQRLQVAHLLTGKVELADDHILLRANLWNARRKEITWELSGEASLQEVGVLLDDLAHGLLGQLSLAGAGPAQDSRDVPPAAWLAFLQGRESAAAGSFDEAISHFSRAVGLSPQYSAAQLELARLALAASPPNRNRALAGIEEVLSRNPRSARALGLRSYIERNLEWNWVAAADSASGAVRYLPGDAALQNLAGQALFSIGRHREAVEHFNEAMVRDPLNLNIRLGLGLAQEYLGQFDEALKTYRILLGLKPDFPGAHAFRARIKLLQENPDSALRESEQEVDPFWQSYSRILALTGQGKLEEAAAAWADMMALHGDKAAFQYAEIAAYLGRPDESFNWLEAARLQRDAGVCELPGNRFLSALHQDSRWLEMLTELGFPLDAAGLND